MEFNSNNQRSLENASSGSKIGASPFLVHCYKIYTGEYDRYDDDGDLVRPTLYETKSISLFGIKNLKMTLRLISFKDESFGLCVEFVASDILLRKNNSSSYFELSHQCYLTKIKRNMNESDFYREFDIAFGNFLGEVKDFRYCKVKNELVDSKFNPKIPLFPSEYLSDWKEAEFRNTECLGCREECGTFLTCCNKPFCIPCFSNLEKKWRCSECNQPEKGLELP
jgi:hypothetical protein